MIKITGKIFSLLLAALAVFSAGGCHAEDNMRKIKQATYSLISGPILPELRGKEQYVITRQSVTLTRTGLAPETQVPEGVWEYTPDRAGVERLFERLSGVDCGKIKRVEPKDAPDGGFTEIFAIKYTDGSRCELLLDPGVTYSGGELVIAPVREFMREYIAQE